MLVTFISLSIYEFYTEPLSRDARPNRTSNPMYIRQYLSPNYSNFK